MKKVQCILENIQTKYDAYAVFNAGFKVFTVLLGERHYLLAMFSKNAEVVNSQNIEVIEGTDIIFDDIEEGSQNTTGIFVAFDLHNTADTIYEIIYNDTELDVIADQNQAEPQHVHTKVDITIKEHAKMSDGSCKTTYYAGKKCTSCGQIWKNDVIEIVIKPICPH